MIRIVHLGKYYPPASGGIENHTQTLAQAQAELGCQVAVVVVNHTNAAGKDVTFERFRRTESTEDQDGNIRVYRVGRWANLAKLDVSPELPALLRRVHREFSPDIWHLHTPNISMTLAILAEPRIRPLVVTHHSDIVRQKLLGRAFGPLEHAIYHRAKAIFPTSDPYAKGSQVLSRFRDRVSAIPLGINLKPFREPTAQVRSTAEQFRQEIPGPIWLSVGRLIYYKALDIALQALRRVPGTLVVVGTGPMESAWKQRASELGVSERVKWWGRATEHELIAAYHAATALWFPSNARSEGFGLVQIEAIASGCPVINTQIPNSGVPWVCRNEQEGLTVPINDPETFAAAANRLLNEPGLRERLASAGRSRAETEFDWMRMGRRSLDHYQHVLPA